MMKKRIRAAKENEQGRGVDDVTVVVVSRERLSAGDGKGVVSCQ